MGDTLNLAGVQEEQVRNALVSAFPNRFAWEEFVRYDLEQNLNAWVPETVGVNELCFTVMDWARANGRLDALVRKAYQRRPDNPDLKAIMNLLQVPCADPVARASATAETGVVATQSLMVLAQLMTDKDVRIGAAEFQADFEGAVAQIELLGLFKDLHDLLHTLQFQCYKGIAQEAKRFPDDDTSREILVDHELTLEGVVHELVEIEKRPSAADVELGWIQDLRDAHRELQNALQQAVSKPLSRVLWLMDRVLAVQPSQINTRLNMAARAVRLTKIVQALTQVNDRLTGGGAPPAQLQAFSDGIKSLSQLQEALTSLVLEHDRWQALDLDLRRIQANIRSDTQELELSWDRLRVMADPLCGGQEQWAAEIRATCEAVAAAVAAQDAAKERQGFQRLYAQAADRFYRVDTSLKRLCETLRAVGQPLTLFVRMFK